MKVSELRELLDKFDDDQTVVLHPKGSMSGTVIPITGAINGFDWYKGRVMLSTGEPITYYKWYRDAKKRAGEAF